MKQKNSLETNVNVNIFLNNMEESTLDELIEILDSDSIEDIKFAMGIIWHKGYNRNRKSLIPKFKKTKHWKYEPDLNLFNRDDNTIKAYV